MKNAQVSCFQCQVFSEDLVFNFLIEATVNEGLFMLLSPLYCSCCVIRCGLGNRLQLPDCIIRSFFLMYSTKLCYLGFNKTLQMAFVFCLIQVQHSESKIYRT